MAKEESFGIKGGAAINLFVHDMWSFRDKFEACKSV